MTAPSFQPPVQQDSSQFAAPVSERPATPLEALVDRIMVNTIAERKGYKELREKRMNVTALEQQLLRTRNGEYALRAQMDPTFAGTHLMNPRAMEIALRLATQRVEYDDLEVAHERLTRKLDGDIARVCDLAP